MLVKTTDGAAWSTHQAKELTQQGVEVHVALPAATGRQMEAWNGSGAHIHIAPVDFPVRALWRLPAVCRTLQALVRQVQPDLVHSHFVGTTLVMRHALRKDISRPRIFQVPGPLHLEHPFYRWSEIYSADKNDHWIASSRYISQLYGKFGVDPSKTYLSYYGSQTNSFSTVRTGQLRRRLGVTDDEIMIGNMNYMYPPKFYLGQRVGLKCHETVIAALALATQQERRLTGVLVGGAWNRQTWYEERLRRQAKAAAGDRILLPGFLPHEETRSAWADFDLVVHTPISENCGGIHEAMIAGVPVITAQVGGLPELVIDGVTGTTVPNHRPELLAKEILAATRDLQRRQIMAKNGQTLVKRMFDVKRTAKEVKDIYLHVLNQTSPRPIPFDAEAAIQYAHLQEQIA